MLKTIAKTREYLNYIELHYNFVQAAYQNFLNKIKSIERFGTNKQRAKYSEINTFLSHTTYHSALENDIKNHDLSKLSENEFVQYRKHFYPVDDLEKENNKSAFGSAWEHHKNANTHHWQHRCCSTYKPATTYPEYIHHIIHNVIDWVAMAYQFNESSLRGYYLKNKHTMQMDEEDFLLIETIFDLFDEEIHIAE